MWKAKNGRKFSRKTDQRKALMKSLVTALFLQEKIKTTEAKAKQTRMIAEKIITDAKKNNLVAIRKITSFLAPKIVKKLISEIGPRYKERNGGYTRIIKLGPRKGDSARMAIIELIK